MLLLLMLSRFSCVQLCATPKTAPHQAPLSLGFSRQEHWSGLPFPFSNACMPSCFSHVRLCVTPWTAAHQAPPSTGFSWQEYWSGLPIPSPYFLVDMWNFLHWLQSFFQIMPNSGKLDVDFGNFLELFKTEWLIKLKNIIFSLIGSYG